LRNSSISFVRTGRGVEYATRFRVTSFELVLAAIAAPATVVANAATTTEIQANLFRCIALLRQMSEWAATSPGLVDREGIA
jgi:hypothetical protein